MSKSVFRVKPGDVVGAQMGWGSVWDYEVMEISGAGRGFAMLTTRCLVEEALDMPSAFVVPLARGFDASDDS